MKNRVLVLVFLSLLWVGMAEAAVDKEELRTLLTRYPLTASSSLGDQLGLLGARPQYFKDRAKQIIPFKEVSIGHPSPKAAAGCSSDEELEEDLSSRSPVTVEMAPEILPYDEEEMVSRIASLCYPTAAAHYEAGIRALFASGKPPKHDARHLTEGLQCLASKMLFVSALVEKAGIEEEIGESLQMAAINQVLKFHRTTLTEQSPTLASTIPASIPGCPACLALPNLPKS